MLTEQQILEQLRPLVRQVTGVSEEEIHLNSNLMHDLGAASLDLLDLSFLVEEAFGITLTGREFEQQVTEKLAGQPYQENGLLTDAALTELRQLMPEVPAERLQAPLPRAALPTVLNVAVFVHLIERKLAEADAPASIQE